MSTLIQRGATVGFYTKPFQASFGGDFRGRAGGLLGIAGMYQIQNFLASVRKYQIEVSGAGSWQWDLTDPVGDRSGTPGNAPPCMVFQHDNAGGKDTTFNRRQFWKTGLTSLGEALILLDGNLPADGTVTGGFSINLGRLSQDTDTSKCYASLNALFGTDSGSISVDILAAANSDFTFLGSSVLSLKSGGDLEGAEVTLSAVEYW